MFPEPRTTPPENKDQARINRLEYMCSAKEEIFSFLDCDEYKEFFCDEILSFLADISYKVQRECE